MSEFIHWSAEPLAMDELVSRNPDDEYRPYRDDPDWDALRLGRCALDWARVAERYQGIIIAPYCWSRRMDVDWYYGWDCASGCVWDVSAIESIGASRASERAAA